MSHCYRNLDAAASGVGGSTSLPAVWPWLAAPGGMSGAGGALQAA